MLARYYTLDEENKNATFINADVLAAFEEYTPRHDTVLALPLIAANPLGNLIVASEDMLKDAAPAAYVFKVGKGGYNTTGEYVEMDQELEGKIIYYQQHNPFQLKVGGQIALSIGNDHILVEK